jgi:hypothetical protein
MDSEPERNKKRSLSQIWLGFLLVMLVGFGFLRQNHAL